MGGFKLESRRIRQTRQGKQNGGGWIIAEDGKCMGPGAGFGQVLGIVKKILCCSGVAKPPWGTTRYIWVHLDTSRNIGLTPTSLPTPEEARARK